MVGERVDRGVLFSRSAELRSGGGVSNGSLVAPRATSAAGGGIAGGASPILAREERPWRARSGDANGREAASEAVSRYFAELKDPRSRHGTRHQLLEILMIALCTILSGGQTVVDMALFGEAKRGFLNSFLGLKNGIPSHDTFGRVFRRLDPDEFRRCFQRFITGIGESCRGVIAIDGKALRRSFDTTSRKSGLHMVSAWACEKRLVLAQVAADAKANESAAVPKLLDMLSLPGTIVTTDALHCRRELAERIVSKGGDYALPVKGNKGAFYADIRNLVERMPQQPEAMHTTVDSDHGRIEIRTSRVLTEIEGLQKRHQWPGLAAVGTVVRSREVATGAGKDRSTETGYYALSAPLSAERLADAVRSHWGIENGLHWALDVVMHEDQSRSRMDNGPYNLAILRHMALNLMRKDQSTASLRAKFNLAAWSSDYLAKLLAQG
jgi:predicted transposase YbfD/YdcC